MKILKSPSAARTLFSELRKKKNIGFVPTMGYLHEGHLSLIDIACKKSDVVVVSIFVNPLQFAPHEDFRQYPRDFRRDEGLCRERGVDYIFYPTAKALYPEDFSTYVDVENLTEGLEGEVRPGHFRGVATVVLKLFNIIQPHIAVFGQKDAQQLCVIRKMVEDLNLGIKIIAGGTVREPDGLAMSSRNTYLNPEQRKDAAVLYKALLYAKRQLESGSYNRDLNFITHQMYKLIKSRPTVTKIDYISFNDYKTLKPYKSIKEISPTESGRGSKILLSLAVRFNSVRLIDNVVIEPCLQKGKRFSVSN
jgi:pantoate--beta-alanine ligase